MKQFFKIIFSFLLGPLLAFGQDYFYENITQESGLPTENIFDVYKDTKGYIWLASDMGLIRYNGYEYVLFQNNEGLSNAGTSIKEDVLGRIWYQNFDGYLFVLKDHQLSSFLPHIRSDFVPYILNGQYLYKISGKSLLKIDLSSEKIIEKKFKNLIYLSNFINNEIVLYDEQNIYYLNTETFYLEKKITYQQRFYSKISFSGTDFTALLDKSIKTTPILLINNQGIVKKGVLDLNETIQNLYFFEHEFWCFTKSGIEVFDYDFKPIKNKNLLNQKNVSSLTMDKNGLMWIGSPTNGVYLIKDTNSLQAEIENDEFSSISHNQSSVFAGTSKGKIYALDNRLNKQLYFDTNEKSHILFMDFMSIKDYGFFTGNGFFVNQRPSKHTTKNYYSTKDITKINPHKIAIAATGIAKFIDLDDTDSIAPDDIILQNKRCKSIAYDESTKNVYLATNEGLFVKKPNYLVELKQNQKPILLKSIRFINNQLVGLNLDGKVLIIENNKLIKLKNNEILNHLFVYKNKAYFSSNNSIYSLSKQQLTKIKSISKYIQIKDFVVLDSFAYIITKKKLLKIPLNEQFTKFEKPVINLNKINQIKLNELNLDKISFNYQVDNFYVDYSVINFDLYNNYEFYYTLNNKKYSINPTQNYINLPNLSSGQYQLIIFAKKENETKPSIKTQAINFEILPPFWRQTWFILLMVTASILLILFVYKKNLKKIKQKSLVEIERLNLENNLKESRLQLIKSQMNPHFFFNAINNIQSYIVSNEPQAASGYLHKLTDLTRKILEFSELETISLEDEIESLKLYLDLQKMRFSDFNYIFNVDHKLDIKKIKIPTMLVQPYAENAIIHGLSHSLKNKMLQLNFVQNNKQELEIEIIDNGVGRKKSQEINALNQTKKKSFATKANLERIMLLNKNKYQISVNYYDLYLDQNHASGTKVLIKIKV